MLEMMDNLGYPLSQYRPSDKILKIVPFSSSRKCMITCVFHKRTQGVRIYVKGASEILLDECVRLIGTNGT